MHEDCNCNCVEDCESDIQSLFAIKTMKDNIAEKDFKSKWEKNNNQHQDCKEICSYKGISVSIFNDETKDKVTDAYKQLFPLSPKYRPYLTIIRFGEDCGVLSHTPIEVNPHHYDFYKCDVFDYQKVELIESKLLGDV